MQQQVCRDIKRQYYKSKKARFFQLHFQKAVTGYIEIKVFPASINWQKLEYELKTIARKCKQKDRSATCYLRAVIGLVIVCLEGNHKAIPSQNLVQTIYQ